MHTMEFYVQVKERNEQPQPHMHYSAVHSFWSVEMLAGLADGSIGCGEVARGGCLFARNFSVTSSFVLTVVERRARPNDARCVSDSLRAYRLKIRPAKNRALRYATVVHCSPTPVR